MGISIGEQLHGLLLVDKPKGVTSHDVVQQIRRICGTKAVGHTGTLDPLATGLMVLLMGEGTKISQYILSEDKGYEVKARLGLITDTLDTDGEVIRHQKVALGNELIKKTVESFYGSRELKVPVYSAVKKKGKKLYELARESKPVEAPVRSMHFYAVKVLEARGDRFRARVCCQKGGYIRSWVQAIGDQLECGASVEELRRFMSGQYHVDQAVELGKLGQVVQEAEEAGPKALGPIYIPLNQVLPQWKTVMVRDRDERLMINGQISHDLSRRLIVEKKVASQSQKAVPIKVLSSKTGQLLSILEAMPEGGLKIRRIFLIRGRHRK